jgi:hypothetical protein
MARVSSLYKYYDYADIAAHPALLYLPYTKSTMSFFEWCGSPVGGAHGYSRYSRYSLSGVLSEYREYSCGHPKVLRYSGRYSMGVPIFTASLAMLTALESDGRRMMWCVRAYVPPWVLYLAGALESPRIHADGARFRHTTAGGTAQGHARHLAVQSVPRAARNICKRATDAAL